MFSLSWPLLAFCCRDRNLFSSFWWLFSSFFLVAVAVETSTESDVTSRRTFAHIPSSIGAMEAGTVHESIHMCSLLKRMAGGHLLNMVGVCSDQNSILTIVFVGFAFVFASPRAEEIGVEHLLRDIRDTTVTTLTRQVGAKLSALRQLKGKIEQMKGYLDSCVAGTVQPNATVRLSAS
jgi:hypothetical protein